MNLSICFNNRYNTMTRQLNLKDQNNFADTFFYIFFCNFRINISLQKICFHPFFSFFGRPGLLLNRSFPERGGEFLPSDNSLILMLHFGDKCDFRFSRRLNDLDLYLIVCTCVLDQSRNLFCKVNQA